MIHLDSGLKVDLFPTGGSEYDELEFARAQSVPVAAGGSPSIRVKSPEDTVLRKREWFRAGSDVSDRRWHDVLGVLKTQSGRLDVAYLRRWAGPGRFRPARASAGPGLTPCRGLPSNR